MSGRALVLFVQWHCDLGSLVMHIFPQTSFWCLAMLCNVVYVFEEYNRPVKRTRTRIVIRPVQVLYYWGRDNNGTRFGKKRIDMCRFRFRKPMQVFVAAYSVAES